MTPRLGDTVISVRMIAYVVTEVEFDAVRAQREDDRGGTLKTFRVDRLEQVEDGVWQETES